MKSENLEGRAKVCDYLWAAGGKSPHVFSNWLLARSPTSPKSSKLPTFSQICILPPHSLLWRDLVLESLTEILKIFQIGCPHIFKLVVLRYKSVVRKYKFANTNRLSANNQIGSPQIQMCQLPKLRPLQALWGSPTAPCSWNGAQFSCFQPRWDFDNLRCGSQVLGLTLRTSSLVFTGAQ